MTLVHESSTRTSTYGRYGTRSRLRRRRVILTLTALTAAAAVAVVGTGSGAAWAVLGVCVLLGATYAAGLRRSGRLEMERDFRLLLSPPTEPSARWDDLLDVAVRPERSAGERPPLPARLPAWRRAAAMARFLVSYAAGWALSPLVFALTIAVGRTPRDTTGQRWLANLQATQTRLKEHSMRTLVVSAATTASVTGLGGAVVMGGGTAAAAATSPPAAAAGHLEAAPLPAAAPSTYIVQSGDTLSSIAGRFGTTYEALAGLNHITDPNLIYPGELILLGSTGSTTATGATTAAGTYTVTAGDTLSSIAARYGTTYQVLAQINGIADPNMIVVGQVLELPSGSATGGPVEPTVSATTSTSGSQTVHAAVPGTSPTSTVHAASSQAAIAVQTVMAQLGKPYVYGGAGPDDFDCSGLVMYAWAAAGVDLPHYTVSQYEDTTRISESQLEPGDLVFYDTGDGAQPGHVTMYIGNGQIVTADQPGTVVRVEVLDWDGVPMGFGRVI